jgi:tetratricopeptide (TPR) repeat protein
VLPLVILSLAAASPVAQESTAVAEAPFCLPTSTDTEYARVDPSIRQQILGARQRAERTPTAETLGELGILLHAYDQYDRAAACYQRAKQLAPSAFQWSYYLAIARADAGEPEAAIAAFRQTLQLTPSDLPARLRLAELLLARGDRTESRRIYADLVREHADSALAQYGLGRTQAEEGDVAAAVESYRRALDRVPQFGAAHYALALLYRKLGQRDRSEEHLALYQANRERRPRTVDPWLEAIEARRVGPQHHVTRGRALQAGGRHREAIDAFQRALTMNPDLVQAHVNLVAAYAAIRAFDQAEAHYRRALALAPDLAENHYNYGVLLLGVGRQSEAIEAFRRALASNASYADAHNNLGYLLLRDGRSEEALHHFRAALAASPAHRDAHFNLAQALQVLGRGAEAIAHFLEAVKVEDEKTPLYLYYLADAYARQGAADQAVRHAMAARARAVSLGQASLVRTIDENLERFKLR